MSNQATNIIAGILLLVVFFLGVFSVKDDSATMDEIAHLPAGFSYLTQKDMRLNPEHPPLIKDLAAIPLIFIKGINFPSNIKAWEEDINGQWDFGFHFLYQSDNPADKMIFWSRLPMILILILLGFYIFKWARELSGNKVALLALSLFSFSPTFLAHGRLVTTDVGAAAGVFIATYYFIKSLRNPTKKNIIFAGIAFGLAELCKFSVILLIPFFALLGLIWWLIKSGKLIKTLKIVILVFVIGFILLWPIYQYHVWNYPPERQARDSEVFLSAYPDFIKKPIIWAADKPIFRPYAHYLTGLFMVFHRAAFGNTTYFLGEVSNLGWKNYFPVVYSIKVPLALHILTLIVILYAAWSMNIRSSPPFATLGRLIKKTFWQNTFQRIKGWIKNHFPEFAMLTFIGVYWATSLTSNLNIGVRHLLPAFPFTFVLVSLVVVKWTEGIKKLPLRKMTTSFAAVLLGWYIISSLGCFPHFLAYSNELTGGPDKTYIYTVDSNLDWGQDLKRLEKWVDEKGIDKIYVDYFGGGDAEYYLKEKYAPWWGNRDESEFPKGNYLAVSATLLQSGRGIAGPGFNQPTGYYRWLDKYKPVTKIGYSIFVYQIN
jgi:hypothetical protein